MASTSTTSTRDHKTRSGNGNLAAFLVGLPLAAAILAAFHFTALRETPAARYVSHTVEQVEVVLFSCALGALAAKILHSLSERRAWKQPILPAWQGGAVPVAEATPLLAGLTRLSPRLQDTTLTRRVEAVLRFLCQRGSAAELDDHLRALADSDVIAQENSYSLIRFLTWAMPILGFLGTVLGITQAISGVTPEVLEKDLSRVTDGLALAFDATALALAMTMGTMFLTFLVERAEQSLLEAVDRYADQHLAHRFERLAGDSGLLVEATRRNTQVLIDATNELINRQAELWGKSLEEADRRRAAADRVQHERVAAVLETAIERTVQAHAQRLAALEAKTVEQCGSLMDRLATLALAVRDQEAALAQVGDGLATQADALSRLQTGEGQLIRLQETLQTNLSALAGAGAFEEAVHSLTAAVHLLTARTTPAQPTLRRPGVAA